MASTNTYSRIVGVIGAGSFGTSIANILAEKCDRVLLYLRSEEKYEMVMESRMCVGQPLHENIMPILDLEQLAVQCSVIFPMVPSANFRELIIRLAPHLTPAHIIIHGIKGFDYHPDKPIVRKYVKTMSEVILEETPVLRIGCISGPNLAKELAEYKPTATVIASKFDEVINVGRQLLRNARFMVFGSRDLMGVEICGILKNIVAVGAGSISRMNLGENAKATFISRGLVEMLYLGRVMGANMDSFLGLAGVGDLVATCNSNLSRNFSVGYRLANGEKLKEIIDSMDEVAEGVKTINIIKHLATSFKLRCPITETLYRTIHGKITIDEAHRYLIHYPFTQEIDFLEKTNYQVP